MAGGGHERLIFGAFGNFLGVLLVTFQRIGTVFIFVKIQRSGLNLVGDSCVIGKLICVIYVVL